MALDRAVIAERRRRQRQLPLTEDGPVGLVVERF